MLSDNIIARTLNDRTSRMTEAGEREAALIAFYSAERRAGVSVLEANARTAEFAKQYDQRKTRAA